MQETGSSGIRIRVYLSVLLLSFFAGYIISLPGCKDSVTNPPEEKPPGYQEDIPWPSLADCPWPKYRHDAQNTGRSNLPGPKYGVVNWKLDVNYLWNELTVDSSNVFIMKGFPNYLCCYDTGGTLKWKSQELLAIKLFVTPILTSDGNIIIGDAQKIYSFRRKGELNWTYDVQSTGLFITGPAVDKEGNIYFTDAEGNLYSLNKGGYLNWKHYIPGLYSHEETGLTFSPDGKTIYLIGNQISIFSFDIHEKKINWTIDKGKVRSSPVVDCSGNIYFIAERGTEYEMSFYSFTPAGTERFSYEFTSGWGVWKIDPTIDKNGNLFFAGDTLYSLDYDGKLRWKYGLPVYNSSSLSNDGDGNIYLVTADHTLWCFDNNGNKKFSLQYQLPGPMTGYSPVIGFNNTLYLSVLAIVNSSQYSVFSIK